MPRMNMPRWGPSVTVAAVIEDQGRYLLVEEHTPEGLRLNNPAGHLEPGESPLQGVVREALEETACRFVPEALVGVYLARLRRAGTAVSARRPLRGGAATRGDAAAFEAARRPAGEDVTYLRFAFCGSVGEAVPGQALDEGIVRTLWLSLDDVRATVMRHRSPLVLRCIEDHAAGIRHALDVVVTDASVMGPRAPG